MRLPPLLLAVALLGTSLHHAHAQGRRAEQATPRKSVLDSLSGAVRLDFSDGLALFKVNDFQAALIKFKRAYDASKEPRILYNIASCHEKMKQYVKARAFLRRFIEEATAAHMLDAEKRAELDVFIETYDRLIGKIFIDADAADAVVRIDDVEVGTTPLEEPLDIEEGPHRVRVTKPGHREWSATVQVEGRGKESAVHAKLELIRHQGRLLVNVVPKDATVRIDNAFVGVGSVDRVLPSGPHHVHVSAKGFRPREFDAVMADDQVRRLDVTLDAEPRSHTWVWTVVGGVALVAGVAVTAAVLANQSSESDNPLGRNGKGNIPLLTWGSP